MQSMEMCARAYARAWFIVVKKMTRKNEKSVAEERERENLDGERIRLLQVWDEYLQQIQMLTQNYTVLIFSILLVFCYM